MAPHTEAAATTDSTHAHIRLWTCAICRRAAEANAEPQQTEKQAISNISGAAPWIDAEKEKAAWATLCADGLRQESALTAQRSSMAEDQAALKKIAADLYHELLAARAVISEMTNNMTAPQKRVASTNLYEAGFMGASGGMTRAAECHQVLRAAEALGIK